MSQQGEASVAVDIHRVSSIGLHVFDRRIMIFDGLKGRISVGT